MATYRLKPRAKDDLRSIRSWIGHDDPRRAKSFIVELNQRFQKLADLHLLHEVRSELGPDVRIAVHGSYNIYYRFIGPDLQTVQIIRVLNAAMSLEDLELE